MKQSDWNAACAGDSSTKVICAMLQLLSATPLMAVEAVAIDTETTGLDVRNDRVIEMAAVQLDGSQIDEAGAWSTLVQTDR